MSLVLVQTDGAQLEAEVHVNSTARFPNVGILLVHPYSGLGGSMNDYVVAELYRQLATSNVFAAVMRYNQRGVGRSRGGRKLLNFGNARGQQDQADVPDMVTFLTDQLQGSPKRVIIIGYSYGACLAAHALAHPSVFGYVGISFPLGGLSFLLRTRMAFDRVWSASHVSRLLILGSQDQYTRQEKLEEAMAAGNGVVLDGRVEFDPSAVRTLELELAEKGSGKPLLLKVFEGNGHFWESDCALMVEFCCCYCEHLANQSNET